MRRPCWGGSVDVAVVGGRGEEAACGAYLGEAGWGAWVVPYESHPADPCLHPLGIPHLNVLTLGRSTPRHRMALSNPSFLAKTQYKTSAKQQETSAKQGQTSTKQNKYKSTEQKTEQNSITTHQRICDRHCRSAYKCIDDCRAVLARHLEARFVVPGLDDERVAPCNQQPAAQNLHILSKNLHFLLKNLPLPTTTVRNACLIRSKIRLFPLKIEDFRSSDDDGVSVKISHLSVSSTPGSRPHHQASQTPGWKK